MYVTIYFSVSSFFPLLLYLNVQESFDMRSAVDRVSLDEIY